MMTPTPQPLETNGPANGSHSNHRIPILHPLGSASHIPPTGSHVSLSSFPSPQPPPRHIQWVLDLHVLTTGSPTTHLMNPETLTTGAHIPISKHPDPSSLRHQIQCPPTVLDHRSPAPLADSRPPRSNPWIPKLGHWILNIKKPQPPAPGHVMPRSWGPHYWILDPLIPASGFLTPFTLLGPRSLCFDCQIPTFKALHPQPLAHGIPDPQALRHRLLAPKTTITRAQWQSTWVLATAAVGSLIPSRRPWILKLHPQETDPDTPRHWIPPP